MVHQAVVGCPSSPKKQHKYLTQVSTILHFIAIPALSPTQAARYHFLLQQRVVNLGRQRVADSAGREYLPPTTLQATASNV